MVCGGLRWFVVVCSGLRWFVLVLVIPPAPAGRFVIVVADWNNSPDNSGLL